MTSDFRELQQITAMLEDRALARYREVLSDEVALRQELTEIENLRHQSLRADDQATARRMLGADSLWQGWLARRRMGLNQDLARLQVHKAETQAAARTAFARHQVTDDLVRTERDDRRRSAIARAERRLEEGAFLCPDPPE